MIIYDILAWLLPAPLLEPAWFAVKAGVLLVGLLLSVAYLSLLERKAVGYIQARIGPNRVGYKGSLQPIADVFKLLCKELIIPSQSNRYLFVIAPVLSLVPAIASWAVMPFGPNMVLGNIDAGVLFLFAMSSLGVYGVIGFNFSILHWTRIG